MSDNTFDNIWRVMSEYKFELEHDISNDLKCIICLKMLINASNGPCGCRYCLNCIEKYLLAGNEHCPGKMKECLEEKLNFDKDIQIDRVANKNISKVKVKCPEQSCRFVDELRNIEYHIRVCYARGVSCPYLTIGCNESKIIFDHLQDHLLTDNYAHTKLLMEWIENIRNENEVFQRKLAKLENENYNLKNENDIINKINCELQDNFNLQKKLMKDLQEKFNKMEDKLSEIRINQDSINKKNGNNELNSIESSRLTYSTPNSPTRNKFNTELTNFKSRSGIFSLFGKRQSCHPSKNISTFYMDTSMNRANATSASLEINQSNQS